MRQLESVENIFTDKLPMINSSTLVVPGQFDFSSIIIIIHARYNCNFTIISSVVGGFCSYETFVSPDDRGTYNWTETAVESPPVIRELNCSFEPQMDFGMARRACRANNTWSHPDDYSRLYDGAQCVTFSTFQLRQLSKVSDMLCLRCLEINILIN